MLRKVVEGLRPVIAGVQSIHVATLSGGFFDTLLVPTSRTRQHGG